MNRIRDFVRKIDKDIPFNEVEEKKEERTYKKEYQDKQLPATMRRLLEEGKLTEEDFGYLNATLQLALEAKRFESSRARTMGKMMPGEPLWVEFLSHVKGIRPTLTTKLIKHFGYGERYETVSKLWRNSGLDVDENGKAPTLT